MVVARDSRRRVEQGRHGRMIPTLSNAPHPIKESDMFTRNLLAAAALALTAGVTLAQAPVTPATADAVAHQDQRDIRQENRIRDGKADGSLTPREANKLQKQQVKIDRTEQRDAADGKVTPREARHVQKMQNKASKAIYKQKHDAQGSVSSTK
jgi:hypothetical protein